MPGLGWGGEEVVSESEKGPSDGTSFSLTLVCALSFFLFSQGFSRKGSFYSSVAQLPDAEREAALAELGGSRRDTRTLSNRLSIRTAEDLEKFKPVTLRGAQQVTDMDDVFESRENAAYEGMDDVRKESLRNPAYEGLDGFSPESRENPAYEGYGAQAAHMYEAVGGARPPLRKTPSNQSEPGYTAVTNLPRPRGADQGPVYMEVRPGMGLAMRRR